jgi:DNA-binding transcriptional LysR family regulator
MAARCPRGRCRIGWRTDTVHALDPGRRGPCVEDIERHFVVACGGVIADYPAARWLRSVAPHAAVAARSDNWPGLVLAVKSGAGIAPLLAYQEDSELVRVIDTIDLVTPFYLLMHQAMQHTPRVRAFADFVAAEIKAFRALVSG